MGKLDNLLGQVKTAADKLKTEIADFDVLIEAAYSQRARLTDANLSKADFMEYVAEDIRRKGDSFKRKMARYVDEGEKVFGRLEGLMSPPTGQLHYAYLSADIHQDSMTIDAFYWFFRDIIIQRMDDAISSLAWPGDVMPVAERRETIKKLDQEIKKLTAERDTLANELIDAGLAG